MTPVSICEGLEGRTVNGRFPLLEWLGGDTDRGVFLTVRQGVQTASIKLIVASGADADAYLAQWEAAKGLSHPFLAQVMETGQCTIDGKDLVYVVTERAEAVLSGIISKKALEPDEARGIFGPVLDALSYVHEKGLVHGNVRPSNILLVADQWKLSGDGVFAAGEAPKLVREPGAYDAPEAATGRFTAATDMWSFGMTMAEALTQRVPVRNSPGEGDPAAPESLQQPFLEIVRESQRVDPAERCTIAGAKALLSREDSLPTVAKAMSGAAEPAATEGEPIQVVAEPPVAAPESISAAEREGPIRVDAEPSYPFGKVEPVAAAPMSPLFAGRDDKENESRSRVWPVLFGIVVVLAIVAFFVVRGYRIKLSRPSETQNATAVVQPATQPEAPVASPVESQTGSATGQTGSQSQVAGESQKRPTTGPAGPQSRAPDRTQATANTRPATEPQTAAPSAGKPQSAPAASETGQKPNSKTKALHAANTRGAVVKRVLPNVSLGASESMRGPVHVEVRVAVKKDGAVSNADYVSPGPGNYFARISREAARSWRFRPPEKDGHPRPSVWTLRFHFVGGKTEVSATEVR